MKQVGDLDHWIQQSDAEFEAWLKATAATGDRVLQQLLELDAPLVDD